MKAYYQQPAASQYNLDEGLNALVTLTKRSQKLVHVEQQKKFLELSQKPSLALYGGCPEQFMPDNIKNQRLQPFQLPPGEESIKTHPRGELTNVRNRKPETQSGLKGLCPQEGETTGPKDKENTTIVEPLKFYNQLCNMENSLLQVFSKLNDIQYVNGIVNLSKYILTKSETNVLSKGLGFCPIPGAPDIGNIIQDLDIFKRKTRLNLFFQGSNEDPEDKNTQSGVPFEHKSLKLKFTFNPVGPFQLETMFYSIEQDLHRIKYRQPRKKNLTKEEYQSIKSLRNHPDIIIKPADKGSAIVILDKHNYIAEGERQLQNEQSYEETNSDLTGEVIHRVNLFVNNMLQRGQITQKTSSYLTTDIDRTQQFYLLPKIHKDMNNPPGRPIVSGSGGPTEKISQFVDHFIGPLVPLSRSYIRDSTHMIDNLQDFNTIPNMLLCTLDITSIYTNIPHDEGVQAIKELLAIHRDIKALPHYSYIIELLQVVLTNNYFDFNGKHYHQKSGTAMGTKLAPSYANWFMSKFEQDHVYTYHLQPTLWKRFIDDIFLIWPHGMDSFNRIHSASKHCPLHTQIH